MPLAVILSEAKDPGSSGGLANRVNYGGSSPKSGLRMTAPASFPAACRAPP
jgi:hypothetical protein